MSTKLIKTKDIVEATQVSRETLKFYEKKGLIKASSRTTAGYRLYSQNAVQQLHFIRAAQQVGFSLREISELLELGAENKGDPETLKKIAQTKVQTLEIKIEKMMAMKELLETYIDDPESWESDPECASLMGLISSSNEKL